MLVAAPLQMGDVAATGVLLTGFKLILIVFVAETAAQGPTGSSVVSVKTTAPEKPAAGVNVTVAGEPV